MTFYLRTPILNLVLLLTIGIFLSTDSVVLGDNTDEAIQKGQDALTSHSELDWYDSQTDALRPINVQVPSQNYDWLGDTFRVLGWIALALLLGGLVYMLVIAFLRREISGADSRTGKSIDMPVLSPESIEALPIGAEVPISDLLTAARECYQRDDFQRAIVYLFSHQLVVLDQHQLLRLAKGKTNRQYLREIRRQQVDEGLLPLVEQTMLLFERTFFGHHQPSREQFEGCWSQLKSFDSLLARRAEATS